MSVFGKVAYSRSLIAAAAVLMIGSSAFAVALTPGTNQWYTDPNGPDDLAAFGPKYNVGVLDTGGTPANWVLEATYAGLDRFHVGGLGGETVSQVYRNTVDQTLAFVYTTIADGANSRYIVRATLDAAGWTSTSILNAGADLTGGSSGTGLAVPEWTDGAPAFIARSEYSPNAPEWQFQIPRVPPGVNDPTIGTVIGPNNRSAQIWFVTNAKAYTTGVIGYLDSGTVGQAGVYAPVPDPATFALLGLATGGLALFRRRRTA